MSLGSLFHVFLYQPILNILILLYFYLPGQDLIWAVIILTILLKFALYPISLKTIKTQEVMSKIDPKMKEIKTRYKDDPARQSKEIMALYKEYNIKPWSSLIYPLIQLPIIIVLFRIFQDLSVLGLSSNLYSFTPIIESANMTFLGNADLTQPSIVLAVLAGLAQYWQQKTMDTPSQSSWQKNMVYFFPAFTFFILTRFSAVLGVYWLVNILFTIGQQYYLKNKKDVPSLRIRENKKDNSKIL
jgi:YidC/Oxa1 family membrane protein insertase